MTLWTSANNHQSKQAIEQTTMNTCPNCKQSLPKWHRERAAFERGERVEYQVYSAVAGWSPWADMSDWHKGQDWRWEDVDYRFRIAEPALQDWQRNARGWEDADPYAELKRAYAAGKVIQFNIGRPDAPNWDECRPNCAALSWCYDIEKYRIKPELPPIPEGFTRWEGGECPVADNVRVEVILRNGDRGSGPAGFWTNFNNWWKHQGAPMNNIIAYRPLPPSFVPLTAADVPPGSVFMFPNGDWFEPKECKGGYYYSHNFVMSLERIREEGGMIHRPGNLNPDGTPRFERCEKEAK